MTLKHFLFSYRNILICELEKKRYFSFLRKIFNLFYKLTINLLRKIFSENYYNLDRQKKFKFEKMKLDELFLFFNCDKGSEFRTLNNETIKSHNYSFFYEKYLGNLKNKKINILEIGSHEGKGLAAFYHNFTRAGILGANINPFQLKYNAKRIEEIFIDVSSKKILNNFCNYINREFDIIIDDASHNLRDILITLPILFKKLKKGGFYVIEDLNQFEVYKNLNPTNEKLTPIKILKNIQNNEKFYSKFLSDEDVDYLKKNIDKLYFEKGDMVINGYNISDIVFIKKNV